MSDQRSKFVAFIRCSCGFWREWGTNDLTLAYEQVTEWQVEHVRCGTCATGIDSPASVGIPS